MSANPQSANRATASDDADSGALIQLHGIRKVFLTDEVETHALADVHFEIRKGEYRLAGEPVSDLSPAERARVRNRQIGFIFQAFNLIGDLTVYE